MLNLNIDKLDETIAAAEKDLRGGLMSMDLWDTATGLSLASLNSNPAGAALFNQMTSELNGNLTTSGLPGLNRYLMIDLQGGHLMVGLHESPEFMGLMVCDTESTNLGILVSVVVPKVLKMMNEARID